MQKKLLEEMKNNFTMEIEPEKDTWDNYKELEDIFKDKGEASNPSDKDSTNNSNDDKKNTQSESNSNKMGVLIIKKIGLECPILDGDTKYNMNIGAARIKGTSNLGEIGNIAITGHRSHTYGKLFNRLDEIEKGDVISIIDLNGKKYDYVVYKKHIVKPNDTSVLNRNDKDRVLTLITCDPVYNPINRLVVHAVLK